MCEPQVWLRWLHLCDGERERPEHPPPVLQVQDGPDPEPRNGQATDVLALLSAHGLAAHASEDDADADADDGDDVPVASSKLKRDGRAGNRGAKKRKSYTNDFKAEALDLLATAEGQGWQLQAVAERLGVSPGMLSS